jgi:hypothetical protein
MTVEIQNESCAIWLMQSVVQLGICGYNYGHAAWIGALKKTREVIFPGSAELPVPGVRV